MTAATSTHVLSTWTIDASHSHVEFAVRHMMVSTAKGHFEQVNGTVEWDGTNLDSAVIDVEIPVASISTKNEQRDTHLKSPDFFDAAMHPAMHFKSTKITAGSDSEFTIEGELTIRGTTRPITLKGESNGQLRDPWGMDRAGFSATGKLDRLAYGLNWNTALETGGFVVGSEVKISLDIEITKPGE